jgi:hypothetical protein
VHSNASRGHAHHVKEQSWMRSTVNSGAFTGEDDGDVQRKGHLQTSGGNVN